MQRAIVRLAVAAAACLLMSGLHAGHIDADGAVALKVWRVPPDDATNRNAICVAAIPMLFVLAQGVIMRGIIVPVEK